MDRTGEYRERSRHIHPPAYAPGYKTTVLRSPRLPLCRRPRKALPSSSCAEAGGAWLNNAKPRARRRLARIPSHRRHEVLLGRPGFRLVRIERETPYQLLA